MLEQLPRPSDPRLLVGSDTADDAGVYKLNEETALIQTVDFFTPIVDDPYAFGQISAANSLSDVYAMGGTPLTALNIVGFHPKNFPLEVLGEILKGGYDKAAEAGALIVGGHTVQDEEMKYGLAVTGLVHPEKVITNAGAKPGDLLVLTKPLGTGIITTALKAGKKMGELEKEVIRVMSVLNKAACETMVAVGVHACTDITGFGLLGHACEMAAASKAALKLRISAVPFFPKTQELIKNGFVPGGTHTNQLYLKDKVRFGQGVSQEQATLLFDAQTSGGLLIAVAPEKADELLERLQSNGVEWRAVIGEVVESQPGTITVNS